MVILKIRLFLWGWTIIYLIKCYREFWKKYIQKSPRDPGALRSKDFVLTGWTACSEKHRLLFFSLVIELGSQKLSPVVGVQLGIRQILSLSNTKEIRRRVPLDTFLLNSILERSSIVAGGTLPLHPFGLNQYLCLPKAELNTETRPGWQQVIGVPLEFSSKTIALSSEKAKSCSGKLLY